MSAREIIARVLRVTTALRLRLSQTLAVPVAAAVRLDRVNLAPIGRRLAEPVAAKRTINRAWRSTGDGRVAVSDAVAGVIERLTRKREKRLPVSPGWTEVRDFHSRQPGLPKDRDEPWSLMTDVDGTAVRPCRSNRLPDGSSTVIRQSTVEELFRDTGRRRNGRAVRDTQMTIPGRFDRFLLILASAYALPAGVGRRGLGPDIPHPGGARTRETRSAAPSRSAGR